MTLRIQDGEYTQAEGDEEISDIDKMEIKLKDALDPNKPQLMSLDTTQIRMIDYFFFSTNYAIPGWLQTQKNINLYYMMSGT